MSTSHLCSTTTCAPKRNSLAMCTKTPYGSSLPALSHQKDSKGALGSSQFQSQILDNREKQENPVTSDPGLTVLAKHLDGSKHIIKFEVPDRVDFGDKIIVHWSHTGTPHENDWVAMYAEGKSGSGMTLLLLLVSLTKDYYSYQWVTPGPDRVPFAFDTPYSAANNFYFCYYSNKSDLIEVRISFSLSRSYVLCAESSVVKIGPKYSIDFASCNENKNNPTNLFTVGLKIKQEGASSDIPLEFSPSHLQAASRNLTCGSRSTLRTSGT